MGVFVSVWKKLFGEDDREYKILILGLDKAGKTTILERIQGKEGGETVPTIGYNHKEVKMRNVTLDTWDLSGQERMRKIWKHYFVYTCGVIFVID
jgi:small GTP-binding protein